MRGPVEHVDLTLARRRLRTTRIIAAVCALAAVGCVAVGTLDAGAGQPGAPAVAEAQTARPLPTPPAVRHAPARRSAGAHAPPAVLQIPAIDLDTQLVPLGLQPDRTVEVPADPELAGWYRFGVIPGQHGAAVILGHVDSVEGPAVFALLSTLRRGDQVDVELASGHTAAFTVTRVRTYPNATFPAKRVYRSRHEQRTLNLVTCGGVYDRDRGGYQSNVVVYTRHVHAPAHIRLGQLDSSRPLLPTSIRTVVPSTT